MLRDVTLGQYFPGNSVVHRLDPRTKLVLTLIYIVTLFLAVNYGSYAFMIAVLAVCIIVSKIRLRTILRGVKPLIIVIIITGLLNLFYTQGEPIVKFWIFTITFEGIKRAVFMILRIIMLIMGTFLLTYTTSPVALTD